MDRPISIYQTGGGWGDAIYWLNKEQFEGPGTHFQVVGFKQTIPSIGDFLLGHFEKGVAKFQFVKVEPQDNPPDMFFATVTFIGYVDKDGGIMNKTALCMEE